MTKASSKPVVAATAQQLQRKQNASATCASTVVGPSPAAATGRTVFLIKETPAQKCSGTWHEGSRGQELLNEVAPKKAIISQNAKSKSNINAKPNISLKSITSQKLFIFQKLISIEDSKS